MELRKKKNSNLHGDIFPTWLLIEIFHQCCPSHESRYIYYMNTMHFHVPTKGLLIYIRSLPHCTYFIKTPYPCTPNRIHVYTFYTSYDYNLHFSQWWTCILDTPLCEQKSNLRFPNRLYIFVTTF
jgi:hypothetical protein